MVHRKSHRDETNRLLEEIHEEVKQLRAATQLYTALVERFLATEMATHAGLPAVTPKLLEPFKDAS